MGTSPAEQEMLPEWGMTRRRDRRRPRTTPVIIYLVFEDIIICIKVWD
jgi:hypothetical protein